MIRRCSQRLCAMSVWWIVFVLASLVDARQSSEVSSWPGFDFGRLQQWVLRLTGGRDDHETHGKVSEQVAAAHAPPTHDRTQMSQGKVPPVPALAQLASAVPQLRVSDPAVEAEALVEAQQEESSRGPQQRQSSSMDGRVPPGVYQEIPPSEWVVPPDVDTVRQSGSLGAVPEPAPAPAPAPATTPEPPGIWPRGVQDTDPFDVVQCDVEVTNSICLGSTMLLPPARMTGLQGHWSFDEVWPFDGSGNRLDGRTRHVAGPAFGQGSSALFHERSPIEVRHTGQLTAQSFSYTFWIFLIEMGAHERGDGEACTVLATGPREDPASRAVLVDPGSGELRIECPTRDEADEFIRSQSRLETNRWYHVALVRLDGERRTRLYVNGILDSSVITTGYTAVPDTRAFFLGGRPEEPACSAAMYLDEVKVFDRPLLPDEIQAEAALSLGGIEASFFRLACLSCPLEEAAKNCPEAYHICSDLELHMGGYAVARSLGWLQQSSHVWGRAKEVDKTAAHPCGALLEQVTHTPGSPTSPDFEGGTMGLGLCCADG